MEVIIRPDYDAISLAAAEMVAQQINDKPNTILGLATGSTPIGLYTELIRMHKNEGLDFSHVTTFNLDEYVGLDHNHPQSYYYFMWDNLFKDINIPKQNINVPSGTAKNHMAFCEWYEESIMDAGGIDLQILGIGGDGHIAFNEPSSSLASRTRLKTLTKETIDDNARFFDNAEEVPRYAITMGVGTVLEAKKCILLANGEKKADIIAQAIEGPVTSMITASALQLHPWTVYLLDEPASSKLQLKEYYNWVAENKPE
jgi:glucosamine-6-phosphate deaminase